MHQASFLPTVVCCECCVRNGRCGRRVFETGWASLERWVEAAAVLVEYHASWTSLINIFRACPRPFRRLYNSNYYYFWRAPVPRAAIWRLMAILSLCQSTVTPPRTLSTPTQTNVTPCYEPLGASMVMSPNILEAMSFILSSISNNCLLYSNANIMCSLSLIHISEPTRPY